MTRNCLHHTCCAPYSSAASRVNCGNTGITTTAQAATPREWSPLVDRVPTAGRVRAALPSGGHLGRGGVSRESPAVPGRFTYTEQRRLRAFGRPFPVAQSKHVGRAVGFQDHPNPKPAVLTVTPPPTTRPPVTATPSPSSTHVTPHHHAVLTQRVAQQLDQQGSSPCAGEEMATDVMKERGLCSFMSVPSAHARGAHVCTTKEAPVCESPCCRVARSFAIRRRSVMRRMLTPHDPNVGGHRRGIWCNGRNVIS